MPVIVSVHAVIASRGGPSRAEPAGRPAERHGRDADQRREQQRRA